MARFVYGEELNSELIKLIYKAKDFIFFVSPFIKLHQRLKDELLAIKNKESLTVMVLFGKNEDDVARSLSQEELAFFTQFPNVEIRHEPRLHAKYYGNESTSILTSMNLYEYSMNNNIESGTVHDDRFDFGKRAGSVAYNYFHDVFDRAAVLYCQRIEVISSLGGLRKKYGKVHVVHDQIDEYYGTRRSVPYTERRPGNTTTTNGCFDYPNNGYCIRTGEPIRFDLMRPLSDTAYRTWSSFGNPDYPENYCHFSGEPSDGETCYGRPVLRKYWRSVRAYA